MTVAVWCCVTLLMLFLLPRLLDAKVCPLCGARRKHEPFCPWRDG